MRRHHMGIQNVLEILGRGLDGKFLEVNARIVDEDGQRAGRQRLGLPHERRCFLVAGDVVRDEDRLAAELRTGRRQLRLPPAHEHDAGAGANHAGRNPQSDARPAARDERGLSRQQKWIFHRGGRGGGGGGQL